jgi:hypothetical protein
MAKYPVEIGDDEGTADALNYLLSGPAGLGQNFAGFSSYTPAYLTGNFRKPYSQTGVAQLYVAPISCSSAVQLDDRTFQYNFSVPQATPPFSNGNNIRGDGWTNDFYNGNQGVIGVVVCTTTYVIFRTNTYYPGIGDDFTGGTVSLNRNDALCSTDCNARVTVSGGTDRVFISGQLDQTLGYTGSGDMVVTVQVNRYYGIINNNPINPDYIFLFDGTVAEKVYSYTGLTTGSTLIETIFSTIVDQPKPNYYWYILEVTFTPTGSLIVNTDTLGLRSLSAQVVKQ